MSGATPQEVLDAVNDGALTILARPAWLTAQGMLDLQMANAGCLDAAVRLVPVLAGGWSWRVGYDNLAEMVWSRDPSVVMRAISVSPAHALLLACLRVLVMGPQGATLASGGGAHEAIVEASGGGTR